jgi:hypothetical protein
VTYRGLAVHLLAAATVDLDWSSRRPSKGKCTVTALVVQDYLGGELDGCNYPDSRRISPTLVNQPAEPVYAMHDALARGRGTAWLGSRSNVPLGSDFLLRQEWQRLRRMPGKRNWMSC